MQPRLRISIEDNNAKSALLSFWLPEGESFGQSLFRANALRAALLPLTNGRIAGARFEYDEVLGPSGTAAPDSDVRANLLLFFSDAAGSSSWRIPSPRSDLPFDSEGPYMGIRLQRAELGTAGLLAAIESAAELTRFRDGTPAPTRFFVGSRDTTI